MLVENQLVEVRWNGNNRNWFESKGYMYTKHNEIFTASVKDLMPFSRVLVNVVCDYCGNIYQANYFNYHRGRKIINKDCCNNQECKNKKSSEVQLLQHRERQYSKFVKLCEERGYIPISTIDDYKGSFDKLTYMCTEHGIKETTLSNFERHKAGCNECGNQLIANANRTNISEYSAIYDNKLLNPEDYVNMSKKNLKFICNCCGSIFVTSLDNFIHSSKVCKPCSYQIISQKKRISKENVVKIIESKNNNQLLNPEEYVKSTQRNLKIKCGSCGNIFIQSLDNYKRANLTGKCPDCNENSYGEYLIALCLDKYSVRYNRQFKFPDCKDKRQLPFDFYLPDYHAVIEFDGNFHYNPIYGEESFKRTLLHDAMKNWYCKWNNIDLLRIPYWEGHNIEEILIERLNIIPSVSIKTTHHTIKYIPTKYRK